MVDNHYFKQLGELTIAQLVERELVEMKSESEPIIACSGEDIHYGAKECFGEEIHVWTKTYAMKISWNYNCSYPFPYVKSMLRNPIEEWMVVE